MKRADKKTSTRREVLCLALVSLKVCDELSRRGREVSDVPRLWLDALVRRYRGETSAQDLAVATREFTPWRTRLDGATGTDRAWRQWWRAMGALHRIRRGASAEDRAAFLSDALPEVLVRLGEERLAAVARVRCEFDAALAAVAP